MGDSAENSPAIFIRGGEPWLMSYCWRTYFQVTRMHVVSAHPERHVVVRDCTPLASTDDATGLVDCTQQPAIEAPVVKHTVAALVMAVLPRTPRVKKVGIDPLCPQPCRHP